jgi:hypothetical protein
VLRLGVAGEFVGHGWVGTGRPVAWLPFFQVFGFSPEVANALMPVVGAWDIGLGLLMLALPVRWLLIWTAGWGLFTAFLRPLAGQGRRTSAVHWSGDVCRAAPARRNTSRSVT